jgi:type II secretory pathway pseudopilin PulG
MTTKTERIETMRDNKCGFTVPGLLIVIAIVAMVTVACLPALAGETKYATGTTSAAVVLGAPGQRETVRSIYSTTDKAGGVVKLYAWNANAAIAPSAAPAATNLIACVNATLTTNDLAVYVHADGTMDYRTVSAASTTNVTLNTAISKAGSTSDRMYELAQGAQFGFDTSGAGVGTNKYGAFAGTLFVGLAPIRVVQDGTSNCVVNVTID